MSTGRTFQVERCLGRGGFGEVYLAHELHRGEVGPAVALKVLRSDIDPGGQAATRLVDEGRLLSHLRHPAILQVHDLVTLDGRLGLVTEYVDGEDLGACTSGDGAFGPRAVLEALAGVAAALDAAWNVVPDGASAPLRLVHRDIKPSNIRVSRHGQVKLLDFGIARTDELTRSSRTRTGMMVGSPAFMAPERFVEQGVWVESDVFSLAAVAYGVFAGTRLYEDITIPLQVGFAVAPARHAAHIEARLQAIERDDLRSLLARCLAHEPTERPSPAALAAELEALADRVGGPSLAKSARRRRWADPPALGGELEGKVLTDGAPVAAAAGSPASPPARPAPTPAPPPADRGTLVERAGLVAVALVGLTSVGLGVAAAVNVLLLVGLFTSPLGATRVQAAEAPAIELPSPASPLPVAPLPELSPVAGDDEAPVGSAPDLHVVDAPPRPAAAPVAAPSPPPDAPTAVAEVALEGGISALVVGPAGERRLPGPVPVGRWRVRAAFNGVDFVDAGAFEVSEGDQVTVACSRRMLRCTTR